MPTHTAASPIPAPGQVKRRRSGVLQSSLDLVFSYSRSQQILYGKKQGSAPSFLETSSHSWSPEYLARDQEAGGYADGGEEEEYERDGHIDGVDSEDGRDQRDMSDREGDTDWAGEGSDTRAGSNRRRSSGSPHLFPYDPIPAPTMPPAPPSAYSGHSRSSNAGSTEPTPRIGMLNLLPEYAGTSASRSAQSGGTKRMFSGSSSTSASTVAPAANAKASHPAQRVYEGVSPLDKAEPRDEAGAGVADERTPLVGQGQGQHVTYSSPPESHIHRVTSREIGTSRRRSSVVQRMGDAVERRESMVGGRRASAGRRKSEMYRGESTDGQTLFNAVAVLLGIGILSLPLAFAYAGWIGGTAMLLGFAWLTCHTAKLLARLIQADRDLMGYTDIGRAAFGRAGGIGINLLFCLELFALGVALIVLFGDTLEVLFPNTSSNTWKLLGLVIVLPTTLLPLHLLSLPSLLSTVSTFLLVLTVLLDGFIKTSSPGSIIHPAKTSIGPELAAGNWLGGIGLVLAGFGGHAVVPSLARDMRHPEHFDKVIGRAFAIAAGVSFIAGAAGYLMIGNDVSDEITRDLMQPKYGYPRWLNLFALWMIVIIPLTKFGLCSRPLNLTIEGLLGITSAQQPIALPADSAISDTLQSGHSNDAAPGAREHRLSKDQAEVPTVAHIPRYKYLRVISRTVVTCLCAGTAIILPGFGRVMAFLGSFSAFLICIILPLGFYLRLGPRLVRPEQDIGSRTGHSLIMVVGTGFMIAGTVWAFLPGSGHGDVVP